MSEKPKQSLCLSFQKHGYEVDHVTETSEMMGMETTNEVESELKAEAGRASPVQQSDTGVSRQEKEGRKVHKDPQNNFQKQA